ncbi:MAG TPA: hypothetical protein VJN18_04295 [Polyangiaceae bacterium]|nr:hypothetical protein [Polyangiaceae bacterium]
MFGPYSLPNHDYESTQLRLRPGVDKVVRSGFDGDDKIDAAMYFWDGMSRDNRPAGYYQQKLQHNSALGPATLRGLPPFETGDHTQHFWIKFNYEEQAMLDGLELLCQLGDPGLACSAPPEITSVADLPAASSAIRCIADQITRAAGTAVLSEFPVQALDPLRRESSIGSFPATGGALGVDISSLRGALAELADVPLLVGDQIKQLSAAIDSVYLAVQDGDLSKKLADVELQSTMASQISTCMASAAGLSPGAIATCANSLAQVGFAEEINSISKQKAELGVEANFNDFTAQFSTISTTMGQLANRLTTALSTIDAQLVAIEQQHNQAKLALARALYVRTFTSQFETRINAVHASRFQTARTRYEQAHTTAQRMAFLAKRAIEMRLGLRLSELTDELPLVEAPAKWESTVCATTGINYESLADGSVLNYADAFIGEYVAKLEHVVESYRLVNNFHEGADAAVISLRDDVHNMKATCAAPVGNELYHAGQLNTGSTGTTPGWDRVGCRTQVVGVQTVPVPNCIGILEEDGAPVLGVPERSTARAHRLQFGDLEGCTSTTMCGYQTGAALAQEVEVSQGTYRASVYVRDRALFSDVGLRMALDGVNITGLTQATQPATLTAWARVYIVFDVPKVQTLRFAFGRPTLVSGMTPADDIVLAAPMLERLPTFDLTEIGAHPVAFANTTASLTCLLPVCEDTTGEVFRNKAWRRGSARLCPDGFTGECAGSTAREIGYWETSFSINQRDIESGRILGNSGFAKGNFNYRIDSIGVNFVGTGVRNCSESTSPSTCYASGFVPYSLIHNGPYIVRNHQGKDFEAKLFTGRIEHARGLATERYLTSPLSSSDRDLLTDFKRLELQGRPLDGNFVLRVWDDPGVDFGALEDVQIVLNYRYWTRFN